MILDGTDVPPDAVRIEEMINAFDYSVAPPEDGAAFARHVGLATCPWNEDHLLARVTLKGREVSPENRPPANLVFLIDVSGSMADADKLPLLKSALAKLLESLDERDRLAIAVYAGSEGLVLPSTRLDSAGKDAAMAALQRLEAGGSTNGGAGIDLAYRLASERAAEEGIHRVILATDGDFNVGVTGDGELVDKVKAGAKNGVGLSVLAFGRGNLNDSMLEAISNDGDGNYFYLDSPAEADRVLRQKLTGTLVTIAKDVKIQVEFNPVKVGAYRLIGYANRQLRDEDFNDDRVDAGDIGAGHTVTAFYEIAPAGGELPELGEVDPLRYQGTARAAAAEVDGWFTLKLRFKQPEGGASRLLETEVKGEPTPWADAGRDFRLGAGVAAFGMKLREMQEFDDVSWERIGRIAGPALDERNQATTEFRELLERLASRESRR